MFSLYSWQITPLVLHIWTPGVRDCFVWAAYSDPANPVTLWVKIIRFSNISKITQRVKVQRANNTLKSQPCAVRLFSVTLSQWSSCFLASLFKWQRERRSEGRVRSWSIHRGAQLRWACLTVQQSQLLSAIGWIGGEVCFLYAFICCVHVHL